MAEGPLKGLRVLDLSRLLPGPYATLLLSDLGAEVVKVEDPDPGDYLREISPAMFAALNRGKKSVVLDLKSASGAAELGRLCGIADVLVESFRPGVLERLLPPPWPPRLIVCRISGFGQTGPWRDRAGHDIGFLALAGALSRTRGVPWLQLGDLFGGGQQGALAVLAALVQRERTGKGAVLDVALAEGATGLVLPHVEDPSGMLDGSRPCYRMYACARGAYALGALEPKFWQRFCARVERPQWVSRAFDATLTPEVDALFASRARDEWDALLREVDCCGEPVLEISELREHPLFAARSLFAGDLPRTFPALVPTAALPRSPAPARGEHTAAVLREWSS